MTIKKIITILFALGACAIPVYPFDHIFYAKQNKLSARANNFAAALNHFAHIGKKQGLKATATLIENTNFDWEYYTKHNKLIKISTEKAAYAHYLTWGKKQKLPYCKQFDLVILLHLYDLDLMDEMIGRINYFINNNPKNNYRIKINVPVTERILELPDFCGGYTDIQEQSARIFIQNKISTLSDSPQELIKKPLYSSTLYHMHNYLEKSFVVPPEKVQIVFSENRGMDIGGFFVLLHELNKENIPFDYLLKLHTKKGPVHVNKQLGQTWKSCLMSFLNIKINKLLRTHDAVYPCIIKSLNDPERFNKIFIQKQRRLCKLLNINLNKEYDFCAGTTFIVPYAFVTFVKKWNFNKIYSLLEPGRTARGYEHVFERLFGYVGGLVSSKIACFDNPPRGCHILHDVE